MKRNLSNTTELYLAELEVIYKVLIKISFESVFASDT